MKISSSSAPLSKIVLTYFRSRASPRAGIFLWAQRSERVSDWRLVETIATF
jgi:hypothetical protein